MRRTGTQDLRSRAAAALLKAFDRATGAPHDAAGYAERIKDKLLPGIALDSFYSDYAQGRAAR